MKQLQQIQTKLKAPKGQYNSFGKYKYRSCEDILEAVKPLLAEQECTLTLSDEIVVFDATPIVTSGATQPGQRFYVRSTATITNASGESISAVGLAREEFTKKGMDSAQITGSTSSYARKYALNGLFAIDDTVDADSQGKAIENVDMGLQTALGKVAAAKSRDALNVVWAQYQQYQQNAEFIAAVKAKGAQVGQ